jgi:hypothetical protein
MKLLALVLVPLLFPVSTGFLPPQEPGHDLPDLEEDLDCSVHWMRAKQDPKTGAYGTGVESTAWVVRAMAASPRKYRISDGSYMALAVDYLLAHQAKDGSIADEGASADARKAQTRVATAALALVLENKTRDPFNHAMAWLTSQGIDDPASGEAAFETVKEKAAARTVALWSKPGLLSWTAGGSSPRLAPSTSSPTTIR